MREGLRSMNNSTTQLLYKLIESDVQNYYKTQTSHHLLN